MAQAIAHIDHHVGLLMDELRRRPNVNVVFLADHGMVNLKNERLVVLEDHLDLRNDVLRIPQYGNVAAIQPKPGRQTAVMQKLLRIPGIRCYEKNQLPENLHYKHCSRVMPIICIPDLGGYIIRVSFKFA